MKPVVYVIEFPSGKRYVGSTCNFSERRRTHIRHARKGNAVNRLLQAEFDRGQAPQVYPVACGLTRETLHELEALVIEQLHPELNVTAPIPLPAPTDGSPRPFLGYPSLAEAARALGLTYRQIKYRAKKELPPRQKPVPKPLTPSEKTRESVIKPARVPKENVSRQARWKRRKKEGTLVPRVAKIVVVHGTSYTLSHAGKVFGVNPATISTRLRRGWTDAQAVGAEPCPLDLKTQALQQRIEEHKARQQAKKFEHEGVTASLAEHCRRLGLSYDKAKYRWDRGVSFPEIVEQLN